MITHANVCHYVRAIWAPWELQAAIDISTQLPSHSLPQSDNSQFPSPAERPSLWPRRIISGNRVLCSILIRRSRVSIIDIVPSSWRSCIQALQSIKPASREALLQTNLRLILSASESLPSTCHGSG